MRILITGGSGFVGQRLCQRLAEAGHELIVVSRDPAAARQRLPAGTEVIGNVLEALESAPEALVNLAGEPIAAKRWSDEQKRRLIDSRVDVTQELVVLCAQLAARDQAPRVLVSASAMGYYGAQPKQGEPGQQPVTEETAFNDEFAHRLCERWESVARGAAEHGTRVALLRIGLVLDQGGGSLQKMLPPFKLGLGGRFGDGRHFMPWVHREDLVRAIEFLLEHDELEGPFNGSAPHPVTNAAFSRTLARQLGRPAIFPVPAVVLKTAFGEMSRLLLTGADMRPARLEAAGFTFHYPTLDKALADILS
ncbi:TIGR01777 family protein [Halomonas sp. ML-15]|uniref:TIGR01777 family oxidoreductase n=1 Tax=Halomonas sp. ML-15 TaxID=2773305 RepID=UPI001746C3B8|nr:TIGR01777 family oxidoreductase [Halomonas sp. ML-15]MBD3897985.1 TIGR01777 family protein [Halomonas sp. ML-15]